MVSINPFNLINQMWSHLINHLMFTLNDRVLININDFIIKILEQVRLILGLR